MWWEFWGRGKSAGGAFGRDAAVADQDMDCGEVGVGGGVISRTDWFDAWSGA